MSEDRIVAVALLTARELNVLGPSLQRLFAVEASDDFSDLIAKLDRIEGMPERPVVANVARRGPA